jgi:HPt (histidine-containing phosphotransfer) domain-containing protein
MNEPGPLNPAAIERLCRLGGEKFASEMIGLFLSYGATKIAEARQAQQAGNLGALADAAHPIKSSAGNVGAIRVQELASLVEQTARQQQGDLANAQLGELERAFVEAKSQLEKEKAKLATKASG